MQLESQHLEKQIEQLFLELVSVWRDSDCKEDRRRQTLGGAYRGTLSLRNMPEMMCTISQTITDKLRIVGIATANHVHDYLD